MNELGEIRDRVIRHGFPELMGEDVQAEYKPLEDALFEYGELGGEGFYIEVDESLREAPTEVMEGGFAHEFAHILSDRKRSSASKFGDRLACIFSKTYRALDEINTDLQVIIRGYGRQLLALLKYSEEKGLPYYREDGLSLREVEAILSQVPESEG